MVNMLAKSEFSEFNCLRDMERVPQIIKVGHVTPHDLFWHNFAFCVSAPYDKYACQI